MMPDLGLPYPMQLGSGSYYPVQTADPNRQGARRTDVSLGVNFIAAGGHRLAFEYSVPVSRSPDGPQLEADDQLLLGYQFSF